MLFRVSLLSLCLLTCGQIVADPVPVPSKVVYGYLEKAVLPEKQLSLKAKLDTGAKSASLYAKRIHQEDEDGKTYLKFVVPTKAGDIPFICEYVGDVSIKARSGEVGGVRIKNPFIKRPVVNMPVQLGEETRIIRVNLANRKRFTYPLLLGREALVAFNGVVDPAQKYTLKHTVRAQ